jgi:hypothetical protein
MECAVGMSMDPSNPDVILSMETVRADRRTLLLPVSNALLDMVPVPRAALHAPGNVPLLLRRVEPKTWRAMQREREANNPKQEASFARPLRADASPKPKFKPSPSAASPVLHTTPSRVTRRMVPVCYAEALPPAGAEHVLGEQLVESYLVLGAERSRVAQNVLRHASMPHTYKVNHTITPSSASSRDSPLPRTRHHSLPPAAAPSSSSSTPPAPAEDQLERAIQQLAARQSQSPSSRAGHALRMLQSMDAASKPSAASKTPLGADRRMLAQEFDRVSVSSSTPSPGALWQSNKSPSPSPSSGRTPAPRASPLGRSPFKSSTSQRGPPSKQWVASPAH